MSSTGFNTNFGSGVLYSQIIGILGIVSMHINNTIIAADQSSILAFVPSGFRPTRSYFSVYNAYRFSSHDVTTTGSYGFEMNTEGRIYQRLSESIPVGSKFSALFIYSK